MWPTPRIFYLCGRRRRCREWEMQLTNVDSCLFFLAAGEETQTSAVSSDTHQGHPAAPLIPAGSYVWHLIQKEEEKTGPMWRTRRYTISDSDANWTFKKASSFFFFYFSLWRDEERNFCRFPADVMLYPNQDRFLHRRFFVTFRDDASWGAWSVSFTCP